MRICPSARTRHSISLAVVTTVGRIVLTALALALALPWSATAQAPAPAMSARAWVLVDPGRGVVIAGQEPHARLAVASLTKVMTAVVALRFGVLTDEYTVDARDLPGEASIGLHAGERVTLETLLYGLLMRSGNDAAAVIARGVGDRLAARRGLSIDGVALFVDLMNEQAADLGMVNTAFRNPHGLDTPGHESSAYDIALLTRHALRDPTFRRMFGATAYPFRGGTWTNVNRLLTQYDGLVGGKTGVETEAGLCLVEVAERDGRQLIVVVLNAPRWYDDARTLLDYGFSTPSQAAASTLPAFGAAGPATGPPYPRTPALAAGAAPTATLAPAAGPRFGAAGASVATPAERPRGAADDRVDAAATLPTATPAGDLWSDPTQIGLAVVAVLIAAGAVLLVLRLFGLGPLAGLGSRASRRPGARPWQTYQVAADQERQSTGMRRPRPTAEQPPTPPAPEDDAPVVADAPGATEPADAGDERPIAVASEQSRLLEEHVTLALRHAQAGRLDTAESFFVKAIQIAPDVRLSTLPDFWQMSAGGYVALALAYRRCSRPAQARAVVGLGLVAFPEHADLTALDRRLQAERRV
ncbi:MAG: D-alanyl-D-alanine carboxypeptidase [Chloroflexi bacterium]|nr:D-alanyl-D-alanine carboxypeptidase [Chloroflexota bacterium]